MGYLSKNGLDRFLNKLKTLFALKSHVPDWSLVSDTIINGTTYKVFWMTTPTLNNQVYGIAFHPSNGQLYSIYNNKGTYSINSLFTEAMTDAEVDAAIIAAGSIPSTEYDQVMTTAEIDAAIAAAN